MTLGSKIRGSTYFLIPAVGASQTEHGVPSVISGGVANCKLIAVRTTSICINVHQAAQYILAIFIS